jgi:hypothetical protein
VPDEILLRIVSLLRHRKRDHFGHGRRLDERVVSRVFEKGAKDVQDFSLVDVHDADQG